MPESTTRSTTEPGTAGNFGPLLTGIAAAPGSPARLEAARLLRLAFAPVQERIERRLAGTQLTDEEKVGVAAMRNLLRWTAGNLDGTEICAPSERLTLYRGFGSQPLYRDGPDGKPFMLNVVWLKEIAKSLQTLRTEGKISYADRTYEGMTKPNEPRLGGDDFGQVAFLHRDLLAEPRLDASTFDALETFDDSIDYYGSFHTEGELGPTMLFSTSLNPRVAQGFSPGFAELSVCPERALMVALSRHMKEFEVYVPFFVLPEEIVRIEGEACGLLGFVGTPDRCARPSPLPLPEATNEATRIYRSCIGNFATYGESRAARLSERYAPVQKAFYQTYASAPSAAAFRAKLPSLAPACAPSCALARAAQATLVKRQEPDEQLDEVLRRQCPAGN